MIKSALMSAYDEVVQDIMTTCESDDLNDQIRHLKSNRSAIISKITFGINEATKMVEIPGNGHNEQLEEHEPMIHETMEHEQMEHDQMEQGHVAEKQLETSGESTNLQIRLTRKQVKHQLLTSGK